MIIDFVLNAPLQIPAIVYIDLLDFFAPANTTTGVGVSNNIWFVMSEMLMSLLQGSGILISGTLGPCGIFI